jgi:hypothetical protein
MLTILSVINKYIACRKRQRHPHLCHEALGETISPLTLARDVSCKEMAEHGHHYYIYFSDKMAD